MNVRWTPTALRDLNALHDFIAADNTSAAAEAVDRIVSATDALERHPEMGRKGRSSNTRELVVTPYIVVYRVTGDAIEILAIIHGARKWPESF